MKLFLGHLALIQKRVGYTYDEEMLQHFAQNRQYEVPERLMTLMQKFEEFGLNDRCEYITVSYLLLKLHKYNMLNIN